MVSSDDCRAIGTSRMPPLRSWLFKETHASSLPVDHAELLSQRAWIGERSLGSFLSRILSFTVALVYLSTWSALDFVKNMKESYIISFLFICFQALESSLAWLTVEAPVCLKISEGFLILSFGASADSSCIFYINYLKPCFMFFLFFT